MPPRPRNAAPNAVSESSLRSAKTSTSIGSNKRNIDDTQEQSSPVRRSKRVRSTEVLKVPPPPEESETEESASVLDLRQENGVTSKRKNHKSSFSVKGEVKEEIKVSVDINLDTKSLAQQEQGDKKTTVTEKVSKKRKTTEAKETEMVPLRARTQGLRMCVGAHVSAAKGVFNAVHNSMHIGGNAFALFLKSQRKWDNPPLQDDHRDQFRRLCLENKYDGAKHILPHGSYLVNLAQADEAKAKQAYTSFLDDLRRCEALGITLYNFHPGSANQSSLADALARLAKALTNALSETSTVTPVLETMCGHGTTIGGSLTEFRDLLALIPHEYHSRIGICIDTCHSFAAGYDLTSPTGFQAFMKEFEEVVGIQYLRALHLNDSKAPRGSKRDLHANIGTGFLGLRAFHNVMNEPRFEGLPMILETPIDRPVGSVTNGVKEEGTNGEIDPESQQKKTPRPKRPAGAKAATVEDFSVWACEIELLESLIGMDPESSEFRALETKLAEEGRGERDKHQEQYERKLEAEDKKKKTAEKKGQKKLTEMIQGSGRKRKATKKASDYESEDEGCQSH